jgi:protein-S-isoprenylcysteine O-methyltransferase Ste14
MKWLELKIPPLALVILTASTMALGAHLLGTAWWAIGFAPAIWMLVWSGMWILAGVAVCLCGAWAFRQARTTVNPMQPSKASTLVCNGIYRYSRNPMYLGFYMALIGWGSLLGHYLFWVVLLLFQAYLTRFQIVPEERALTARFGDSFVQYTQQVRRWV